MLSSSDGSPCRTPMMSPRTQRYGTLIPNRVFVGGIAGNSSEMELRHFFSSHGVVKDCKVILDRAGVSKGYGFVTFESDDEANNLIRKEGNRLIFKDRKLNIGPAVRKQRRCDRFMFNEMHGDSSPRMMQLGTPMATKSSELCTSPPNSTCTSSSNGSAGVSGGTILHYANGVPYAYHNGMAVFNPCSAPTFTMPQQAPSCPAVVSPQQYYRSPVYFQSSTGAGPSQWNPSGQWMQWNSCGMQMLPAATDVLQQQYSGAPGNQMYSNGVPVNAAYNNGVPVNPAYNNGVPVNPAYNNGVPVNPAYNNGVPVNPAYNNGVLGNLVYSVATSDQESMDTPSENCMQLEPVSPQAAAAQPGGAMQYMTVGSDAYPGLFDKTAFTMKRFYTVGRPLMAAGAVPWQTAYPSQVYRPYLRIIPMAYAGQAAAAPGAFNKMMDGN